MFSTPSKNVLPIESAVKHDLELETPPHIVTDLNTAPDVPEKLNSSQAPHECEEDPGTVGALLGRLSLNDEGQVQYLGSRSNYHLLNHIPRLQTQGKESIKQNKRGLEAANRLGLTIQASPELQKHLLDLFWRWQNSWHYTIIPNLFLSSLEDRGKYSSPLLVSAILALACRFSDRVEIRSDPSRPETAGDEFSEQAKLLLLYESDTPSICAIQAAILLATREASVNKESSGWLYCGMCSNKT